MARSGQDLSPMLKSIFKKYEEMLKKSPNGNCLEPVEEYGDEYRKLFEDKKSSSENTDKEGE